MITRLLSLLVILWALGFVLFSTTLPRPAGDQTTDAIVVLTGGAGRLQRGLDLLAAHRAKRLFVSGADRSVRKIELAKSTGASARLFACCVDLGQDSVDTRSNALETATWLKAHRYASVRLITTDWHMPRAHHDLDVELKGSGVAVLVDAVPSQPRFMTLFTEYQKYLLRRIAAPFGF